MTIELYATKEDAEDTISYYPTFYPLVPVKIKVVDSHLLKKSGLRIYDENHTAGVTYKLVPNKYYYVLTTQRRGKPDISWFKEVGLECVGCRGRINLMYIKTRRR